ncbi:MAG: GIY-YIG nuclease family protein [Paludibacteraceae bacterium]|nr:GIY-YIG nuclease family protein [Paludibacteraceae bacterium]MBN2788063.1 GIY-YIG nuclease family protein [Paludibacteraceae bacterium]
MHFVYILYSKILDKFYIGFTSTSVEERLNKHLSNHKGFTNKASDWKIAYTERFNDKTQAMNRETQIKKWKSKKMIQALIKSTE